MYLKNSSNFLYFLEKKKEDIFSRIIRCGAVPGNQHFPSYRHPTAPAQLPINWQLIGYNFQSITIAIDT